MLAEPGTVGAVLRGIRSLCDESPGVRPGTWPRLPPPSVAVPAAEPHDPLAAAPHVREGDSGVEAVIHRELQANAAAFQALEDAVAAHGLLLTSGCTTSCCGSPARCGSHAVELGRSGGR